ncbi:hypothetical protein [Saccharothrix deserti]|uniref:hypothetical protein n=1 Tax=Saccharothrix deserti TaxID=2593674 RepID=UPI00131B9A09|nr:hypothetical protein [Saccharothrix deserti]
MRAELLTLTALYVGLAGLVMILALVLLLWRLNRRAKRAWAADLAEHLANVRARELARQRTDVIPAGSIRAELEQEKTHDPTDVDGPESARHARTADDRQSEPAIPAIPPQAARPVGRSRHRAGTARHG